MKQYFATNNGTSRKFVSRLNPGNRSYRWTSRQC